MEKNGNVKLNKSVEEKPETRQKIEKAQKQNGTLEKKKNENEFKLGFRGRFYYWLAGTVSRLWRAVFCVKIKRTDAFKAQVKSGACLIVANHSSTFDMISAIGVLYPKRQNFVVAENMLYFSKFFNRVLTAFGAILKKQFYSDFTCVRGIKKNLDAGIPVLICPEGKVSDDGVTQPIVPSTGKLVKWLGYPVVSVKVSGSSLTKPKWAKNLRRGRVQLFCDVVMSADEAATLSAEEINARVQASIANNDPQFQAENGLKYKGKHLAEGLESILFKCPKCQAEFEMTSEGDELRCLACGNRVVYKNTGELVPIGKDDVSLKRIDLWSDYVCDSVEIEVGKGGFRLAADVERYVDDANTREFVFSDRGILSLNDEEMQFVAEGETKPTIRLPLNNMTTLATVPGVSATAYDNGKIYKFIFTAKKSSTKFAIAVECISRLKTSTKA